MVRAQTASNKGTDFWLMYGAHVAGFSTNQNNWQKMAIYVTSDVNTTGTLEIPGINYTASFSVTANAVTVVQVPQTAYIGGVEGKFNKGIHLKSVKPIVAYGHIYDSAVSGATLLLPTNTLGKEYYSLNFTQKSNSLNAYSFCSIVAVEDNTQIIITPSVPTQGGWAANVAKTITLNKGEVYQILALENSRTNLGTTQDPSWSTTGGDLTGTTIKSVAANGQTCKKIAVFSGSTKMSIGCLGNRGAPGAADNLFQQVYPTSTWGKSFVTVPSKNRNYDIYRVFKSSPSAVVKLNGNVISSASFVNNLYYEFPSQQTNYIEADNSIQVVQYQVTQGKSINCTSISGDVGDPEMIFLNPLEQTLNKMTMYSSQYYNILRHYINVVIRTSDVASFTLDGVSKASEFRAVPNKVGYSYAQIEVNAGTHNLQANGGFNAIAYGFGANESYGYAAGASLISPGIEAVDELTQAKKEIGCLGEKYDLFVSLPYQPLSLKVDLDNGTPAGNVNLQLVETFLNNNITYYKYKLFDGVIFTQVKKYLIKVTAEKPSSDGCGAVDDLELEYEVVDYSRPSFDVVGDRICNGVNTTFRDTSQPNGNPIAKWHWDFGNGQTEVRSTAVAFSKTFSPGTYTVKLRVENQAGCLSEASSKTVTVYHDPVPKFIAKPSLCEKQTIKFEEQSTSVDGQILGWRWDFGDGTTSRDRNPEHIYARSGDYIVKYTAISEFNCEKTITQTIKVNVLPTVDFDIPNFCLADGMAVFTNRSEISTNDQLTYLWDFGDAYANVQRPNTSTLRNGEHIYTRSGLYDVTLTVKSVEGCAVVVTKQFRVNGSIPRAAFEVQNQASLCSNTLVVFKDKATVDFGEITKIVWFFNYGNKTTPDITDEQPNLRTGSVKEYTYSYPAFSNVPSKNYIVKMQVYSGGSCVSEETKTITIYPEAVVDFALQSACLADGKANFNNSSSYAATNAALTYRWDFGDSNSNAQNPNTSTEKNPFHRYTRAGSYNVSLTVTSSYSCAKTIVKQITVNGAIPVADFEIRNNNALCSQVPIVFEDKTTLAFGNVTRIDWFYDFANSPNLVETDLNPGSSVNPKTYTHQYPVFSFPFTKSYVVKMVAYSGNTCVSTIQKTVTLKALPDINFAATMEICMEAPNKQLLAVERNAMAGTGVFSGTGVSASGLFNPLRAGVGVHAIKYTFSVANGCTIEKTQMITVNEMPTIDAGDDKIVLEGGQATLSATAYGAGLRYKWSPSTGLDRDDVLNPVVRPTEDMTYKLTVTSQSGCVQVDEMKVKLLHNLEIPNAITPNGDSINDDWKIKYIDSYPTATVEIYDRAGQNVYKNKGYLKPFDGTFNNHVLPVGTYYYIINLAIGKKPITGTLTIIR